MSKGTPASSQIIWLENKVKDQETIIDEIMQINARLRDEKREANAEIKRLREKVNYLLISICEAGDLLDAGQLIDTSNRLDEAKFNHNMER